MGWNANNPGRPSSGTGQNVAIGAASVQSAAASTYCTELRLSATGNCHVEIGPNPTATAASMLIKSSDYPVVIRVSPGEKVAVIQDGASTGNLNICEYTN